MSQEVDCVEPRKGSYFDGMALTRQHRIIFGVIMLAYFFEQMDNVNFGFVAPAMFASWGIGGDESNRAMGLILSYYFIGMMLGGFLGGIISDLIGRRKTFLGSIVLFSTASVVTGLPHDNLYIFIIARALTGFGVFCMMVCSQVYIAEMSPSESRGKWQGLIGAAGFVAVPFIGGLSTLIVPLSPFAWRWIFYLGGLGFIGLFIGLKYLKESPRWLVSQGRRDEAMKIMEFMVGYSVELPHVEQKECKLSLLQIGARLLSPRYIRRTLLLLFLFVVVTPGAFIITSWTPKLLEGMHAVNPITGELFLFFTTRESLGIMTFATLGMPGGCFLASQIAEFGGRKIPMCTCFILAGLCSLAFALVPPNLYLLAVLGFGMVAFNMAGSMIMFTYAAESFPTETRNTATGILNGMARLSVSVFQSLVPLLITFWSRQPGYLNPDMYIVYMTCFALFVLPVPFALIFGERTGGKSLEEIS